MYIAIMLLAALSTYLVAVAIRHQAHEQAWKEIALEWYEAISPGHLEEWDKYPELTTGEKIACHEYAAYVLHSVSGNIGNDDTEESA